MGGNQSDASSAIVGWLVNTGGRENVGIMCVSAYNTLPDPTKKVWK